jgi:hypothetical protein
MGFFKRKYFAIIFDDNGDFVNCIRFKQKDSTIKFEKRQYNIILDKASHFNRKGLFHDKRFFFYNLNNPNPILINKKIEPIFSSKLYNIMLETKVATDLNNLADGGLGQYLTPRNIIIGIIVIGVIIYFTSGGTLTTLPGANNTIPTP